MQCKILFVVTLIFGGDQWQQCHPSTTKKPAYNLLYFLTQGDQMSLWKICQKCSPIIFFQIQYLTYEKSLGYVWIKRLPKENDYSIGQICSHRWSAFDC
jgi:hypothetical protein